MFDLDPFAEEEGPWSDVAQICLEGHVTNSTTQRFPQHNKDFCDKCGQPTITACPACEKPIRGRYHQQNVVDLTPDDPAPAHCIACGTSFPWTESRLAAAKELAEEIEGLTPEERDLLTKSLDDLIRDTSDTPVAATRFKKLIAKVGGGTGKAFYDLAINIMSEAAR
ncbi:MAG: DUF2321 domain-containing protein, partial [Acidobacteria bacterium]|nr:DUF2321 domain-containing protein [Acidobacteriota bacterium]